MGLNIGCIIVFVVLGIILDILFIKSEYDDRMKLATVLKGLASLMFVSLGIYCFVKSGQDGTLLIVLGLIFGMIGDVFLNLRNLCEGKKSNQIFAVGILAFLIGHFLYIAFLYRAIILSGRAAIFIPLAIVLTAVLAFVSIPPLIKRITPPSEGLKKFGYVYLCIVIAMFCASLSRLCSFYSTNSLVFMLGALLFVVSDFIMIYFSFGKKIKPLRAINLLAYYFGQILIALCIFL